jgi:multidrug efflux pump
LGTSVDVFSRNIEFGGPVASFWTHLASAIVSGLTFATLLTLIVTPAMLIMPYHLRALIKKIKERTLFKKSGDASAL